MRRKQTSTAMRTLFCQLLFLITCSISYGQDASYSFEGRLTEDQKNEILRKISTLPGIESAKLRSKDDSDRGEIMLYFEQLNQDAHAEGNANSPFSPVYIKEIFYEFQVVGIDYRIL